MGLAFDTRTGIFSDAIHSQFISDFESSKDAAIKEPTEWEIRKAVADTKPLSEREM